MSEVAPREGERVVLIDGLRGFALFGLFVVHSVELFELYWLEPQPGPVHDVMGFLFAGKSFALFALCFGISFHLIMGRSHAAGAANSARFAWRMSLLFGLGLVHGLIYRGEILQVLAPLGLGLLLLSPIRSSRVLLAIAALCFLQPVLIIRVVAAAFGDSWALSPPGYWTDPTLPSLGEGNLVDVVQANLADGNRVKWAYYLDTGRIWQIAGLFLVGLVLARSRFFQAPIRFTRHRRAGLVTAGVVSLLLWIVSPRLIAWFPAGNEAAMARVWLDVLLSGYLNLALLAVQVVLLIEIYQSAARPLIHLFAAPGRMTLTFYVGQSLIFVPVFYGFGLGWHNSVSQLQALGIGVAGFGLQLALAHAWLARYRYGPLEWAWRAATWTRWDIPLRRASAARSNA